MLYSHILNDYPIHLVLYFSHTDDFPILLAEPRSRTVQETDMSPEMVCVMFDSTITHLEQVLTVNFQATLTPPTS